MKMQKDQKDVQRTQTGGHPPKPEHFRAAATQHDKGNYLVIDRVRHIFSEEVGRDNHFVKGTCTRFPIFT